VDVLAEAALEGIAPRSGKAGFIAPLLLLTAACSTTGQDPPSAASRAAERASDPQRWQQREQAERRRVLIVVMIGMDLGGRKEYLEEEDCSLEGFEHIPVEYDADVKKRERGHVATVYEMALLADSLVKKHGLDYKDVQILVSRGTFGHHTQHFVEEHLARHVRRLGRDAFKVIIGKSFGGTDATRALMDISNSQAMRDSIGEVALLVLEDPTAPDGYVCRATTTFEVGGKAEPRFPVPTFVRAAYCAVQTVDDHPFRGLFAGWPGQPNVSNTVLRARDIDGRYWYGCKGKGKAMPLKLCHGGMDEILLVHPTFEYGGAAHTLQELVEREYERWQAE
jgi:hypothetical protein